MAVGSTALSQLLRRASGRDTKAAARKIPQRTRSKLAPVDFAGAHHSFPIEQPSDVAAAVHALGLTKQPRSVIKRHIKQIAKRKGKAFVAEIPKVWKGKRESLHETALSFITTKLLEVRTNTDGSIKAKCVILCEGPGNPKDRHWYGKEAIFGAAKNKVFEGKHVFIDHPTSEEDRIRPERSIRDLAGYWSDVQAVVIGEAGWKDRTALVGWLNIEHGNTLMLNKLKTAKQFMERYPNSKEDYLGVSINASGSSAPREMYGQEYNYVAEITEAVSADVVTRAGAGGKLLTLQESLRMKTRTGVRVDKTRTSHRTTESGKRTSTADAQRVIKGLVSASVKEAFKPIPSIIAKTVSKAVKEARRNAPSKDDVRKVLEAAGITLSEANSKKLDKALGVKVTAHAKPSMDDMDDTDEADDTEEGTEEVDADEADEADATDEADVDEADGAEEADVE